MPRKKCVKYLNLSSKRRLLPSYIIHKNKDKIKLDLKNFTHALDKIKNLTPRAQSIN